MNIGRFYSERLLLSNVFERIRFISTGLPESWYKRLPPIDEKDIEEKAIKGSGPGGQAINKTQNCCQIKHIPTGRSHRKTIEGEKTTDSFVSGIVVTCQQTRFLEKNRELARRQLQERLDLHHNGENSLVAQYKREKAEKKFAKATETKQKLEKKRAFKAQLENSQDDRTNS